MAPKNKNKRRRNTGTNNEEEHLEAGERFMEHVMKRGKKGRRQKDESSSESSSDSEAEADNQPQKETTYKKWINRQRTLVFSSRGVSFRARHLMTDLRAFMPHSKKEAKLDRKDQLHDVIPEICELKNCNNCVYFEARKKQDLYMWVCKMPHGPSCKFLVENVHTMDELKLTGNFLKGSRPLLNFDKQFDEKPQYQLMKELFTQCFGTPKNHPKSKPFVDHILSFYILDNRVWIRNYQVVWSDGISETSETTLMEAGPRFVLNPIRFFAGTFGGPTLYENPDYVSPNMHRSNVRQAAAYRYKDRTAARKDKEERVKTNVLPKDEVEELFQDAAAAVAGQD